MPDDIYDTITDAFSPEYLFKDLVAVFFWLILAVVFIYVPFLNETFLRVLFALPVVLFIPGYSLIAALFPSNEDIDGIERTALSFGLSIAVVPLIGLFLNYTPFGIRLDPIVISLAIFTTAMLVIAQYRRFLQPEEKRFRLPLKEMISEANSELFSKDQTKTDKILSVVLIISIIAAIATTVFVIVVPKEGEKFTEFYILGEKGMAADYPTKFAAGEMQDLIIGVGNHEYRDVNYFIETYAVSQVFDEKTNTSSVLGMVLLDRITKTVSNNKTEEILYQFEFPSSKYNKLQLLLFADDCPPDDITGFDRINASYRDLHLWVDVREPLG
ncbi:DUF1616 domain-containing protein [Methanomicrobium antiquum]|uniref:DUF1616 domain-containing protein n=1 Tax=Methanomicrobium antiquum TaxID=487686 RepID=A0AAF0JM24_9EURY|nr:DUF1616 domain-containing protein [Methanomicrobium antiquum]WFN37359.1 DUF1616 domain-containing protein [Methanomicrobium antiquum]